MENYEILEEINTGHFGKIWKIKQKQSDKILVAKEIDYSKMQDK